MRDESIARNYAEALFEIAERNEAIEEYGAALSMVARMIGENPDFRLFLETPRVDASDKKDVLRKALDGAIPSTLLNFLMITIDKRRQRLIRDIEEEFHSLVDDYMNRAHVTVTVAREMNAADTARVTEKLSEMLGKTAIPEVRVQPEILGGVVVRAGDTIYDGSLRRRLDRMRRQLLAADLAAAPAGAE